MWRDQGLKDRQDASGNDREKRIAFVEMDKIGKEVVHMRKTRKATSITPQAAGLVKSEGVKCSLMRAFPSKGWLLPSMLELDSKTSRGYPVQVELENRQIHR
jgi:hypothetical protein